MAYPLQGKEVDGEIYMMENYRVGDLVAEPVRQVYGIITEVIEKQYSTLYKIMWQDTYLNNINKKIWDHYEIVKIKDRIKGTRKKV